MALMPLETNIEEATPSNQKEILVRKKDNRKSLTARVKPDDLLIFNQRLKLFGFSSINELVHDFIAGKFPQITEDRQIENLVSNTQSNGQKSVLEGGYNRDMYERVDFNDMYNSFYIFILLGATFILINKFFS